MHCPELLVLLSLLLVHARAVQIDISCIQAIKKLAPKDETEPPVAIHFLRVLGCPTQL